jgi:alkylation response protein AidB-like acyl-CoA dehydrogenase
LVEEFGYAAVPAPVVVTIVASELLAAAQNTGDHLSQLANGTAVYTVSEATRCRRPIRYGALAGTAPLTMSDGMLNGMLPIVPFADMADFVLAPLTADGQAAFGLIPLGNARREPVGVIDRLSSAHVHFDGADADGVLLLATGSAASEMHERCDALMTGLSTVETAGVMSRALEITKDYVSNRVQFGQPVAKFQAARHRLAEVFMLLEGTRWAAYHALWRLKLDPSDTREIWRAKHWSNRAGARILESTHMLNGGMGVATEYPLHLYTKWLAGAAVRSGTLDEMTDRIIADTLASAETRVAAGR